MPWTEYYRTRMPLSSAMLNADACKQFAIAVPGMVFSKLVMWADEKKMCWVVWDAELEQSYHSLMATPPEKLEPLFSEMDEAIKIQDAFIRPLIQTDLARVASKPLGPLLRKNLELGFPIIGKLFASVDSFDIYSEKTIKTVLRKKMGREVDEKEIEKIFGQISYPQYIPFSSQEEKDLLEGALKIIDSKNKADRIQQLAEPLFEKYWWTQLGWERQEIRTAAFFAEQLEELATNSTSVQLRQRLDQLEQGRAKTLETRNKLLQELKLDEIRPILELMDRLAIYHDVRKEGQMKANWLDYRIIDVLANRLNVSAELLDNATLSELQGICDGQAVPVDILQKRSLAYFYELDGNRENIWAGHEATKKIAEFAKIPEYLGNISGTIASRGIAMGRVKVCFGGSDASKKIEKGDILVAGMTTPDFVPAMGKAGAIVTDEGGITCHAAIISRELGIPCIVGTRIGTKVLRDDDYVEVNANHGIVKRLSHAQTQ